MARAGAERDCTEALFTLGDGPRIGGIRPGSFSDAHGEASTLGYVESMCRMVLEETGVFPHANPGLMNEAEMAALRPFNPSMGLMLENVSPRLMEPGMPHHNCPDKDPRLRLEMIRTPGGCRFRSPPASWSASVRTTGRSSTRCSPWRPSSGARMHPGSDRPEFPGQSQHSDASPRRTHPILVRPGGGTGPLDHGPGDEIQVPPISPRRFEIYLDAGINDWGGVSPLTIDWVNPEQPWPHLDELEARTGAAGFELVPRLPVYPEFATPSGSIRGSGHGCKRQATRTGTLPFPPWRSQPRDRHVLPGPAGRARQRDDRHHPAARRHDRHRSRGLTPRCRPRRQRRACCRWARPAGGDLAFRSRPRGCSAPRTR